MASSDVKMSVAERLARYWTATNCQGEYLYSSLDLREDTAAELRRLAAENEQLAAYTGALNERCVSDAAEIGELRADRDRLAAEIATLRADAERYRWLRDNNASWSWAPARYSASLVTGFAAFGTGYLGFGLEDAIDAAKKEAQR